MSEVIKRIEKYNVSKILIDGALFRKSIASFKIADAAILSTGASYSKNINKVVSDTSLLLEELMLEQIDKKTADLLNGDDKSIVINNELEKTIIEVDTVLSNEDTVKKYLLKDSKYLYLDGALSNKMVQVIIDKRFDLNGLTVIVKDATHIVVDAEYLRKLKLTKTKLLVINKINVLFLTYNPHSSLGYDFDDSEFLAKLKTNISIPIINVLKR